MRSEQTAKIEAYRKRLQAQRDDKLAKAIAGATEKLSEATEAIAGMKPDAPVVKAVIDVDTEPLAEAIKNIQLPTPVVSPVINVDVPKAAAPTVVVQNDDIAARYQRYNSVIDPEGTYHGFVDKDSNWFIRLESSSDNGPDRSRFFVGKGDISTAWTKRRSFKYLPFNEVNIP